MMITSESIASRLQASLSPLYLEIIDESAAHAGHLHGPNTQDGGTHFRVKIWSEKFTHQSRVSCHRLVYDALQDHIDQGLHALAIEIKDTTAKESS
jgi:BolA protein